MIDKKLQKGLRKLPLERTGACLKYLAWVFFKTELFEAVEKFVTSKVLKSKSVFPG